MSGTWKAVKPSSMEGAVRIHCMGLHSQGRTVGGGKWKEASRPMELMALLVGQDSSRTQSQRFEGSGVPSAQKIPAFGLVAWGVRLGMYSLPRLQGVTSYTGCQRRVSAREERDSDSQERGALGVKFISSGRRK